MIVAKVLHGICERLPADNGREVAVRFTMAIKGEKLVAPPKDVALGTYIAARICTKVSQRFEDRVILGNTNPSFQVHRPALIQPEMLPRAVSHKVTAPAVGQLVRNNVNILTILRDDAGGGKSKDRVLHTTVGEARR